MDDVIKIGAHEVLGIRRKRLVSELQQGTLRFRHLNRRAPTD